MAAYSSFGTRKALGRRYSIDPAILLEADRLAQEYNLTPGREARALQASQFDRNLALREEEGNQAGKAGMVGTVGNLATTGLTLRAMTMGKGEPFFGTWGGGASTTPTAGTGVYSTGATYPGGPAPSYIPPAGEGLTYGSGTVNPATTGTSGLAEGAAPAMNGTAAVPVAEAGSGLWGMAGGTGAAPAGIYSGPAVAGYFAPKLLNALHEDSTENLGHNVTGAGKIWGGENEARASGGAIAGAAAGAATGAALTSWSGPGAVVGAVVGGIVGALSSIF